VASHKTLKSVVRSMVDSFTSLMNYSGDDYVMGHIVYAAWATGGTELRVDLMTGRVSPSPLLVPPVRDAVARYVAWFPGMVQASNSDMQFVAAAELLVAVDPCQRRSIVGSSFQESPFRCSVRLTDDRGKVYAHEVSEWWYPEKSPQRPKERPWWQFW
jgi:hypothetical protein